MTLGISIEDLDIQSWVLFNSFKEKLVDGLPNLIFEKDKSYDACQFGKQVKSSFKSEKFI